MTQALVFDLVVALGGMTGSFIAAFKQAKGLAVIIALVACIGAGLALTSTFDHTPAPAPASTSDSVHLVGPSNI